MNLDLTPVILYELPAGYTARAGQLSDYTLLFELANIYAERLNGRPDLNDPELIRLDWQNEGFDPANDIQAVFTPDGKLAGLVECWHTHKPPVHPWVSVYVHPDQMGLGLWEYLLTWGENRSRVALDLTEATLRLAPRTSVEYHHRAAVDIIQNLGWQHIRTFYRMEIELERAPEVPALPVGVTIRAYDPATEAEAVYRCVNAAFRDHFGYVEQPFESGFREFKHNLIKDPGYDANFWFVAVAADQIIGFSLCRPMDTEDNEMGWVMELGVVREWRKQGLASALLKRSFAAFHAHGQKRAGLGVDASSLTGALRLYERAGMRATRQYATFEKELRPGREISTETLA